MGIGKLLPWITVTVGVMACVGFVHAEEPTGGSPCEHIVQDNGDVSLPAAPSHALPPQSASRAPYDDYARTLYRCASDAWNAHQDQNVILDLHNLIVHVPDTDAAQRGLVLLQHIVQIMQGDAAEKQMLVALGEILDMRQTAPTMRAQLWTLAGDRAANMNDWVVAERWLRHGVVIAQGTVWWDDALLTHARVLRRLHRPEEAIAQYQRIQDAHTESWFVGSYQSLYLDDALLEMGDAWRERGNADQARRAYQVLLKEHPTSRLVDDAQRRLAALR